MTYYAIQASVHHTDDDGWEHHLHLPTFYLHSNVQGILDAGAAGRVATGMIRDILGVMGGGRYGYPAIDASAVAQHD